MGQTVYADVLFLIDFSMDLLALGAAGRMTQRPAKGWRLCAAAALGGVWSVASLFLTRVSVRFILGVAIAAGMVWLAFGGAPPVRFALTLGAFWLASLLLGGSMTALSNLLALSLDGPGTASGGGFFLLALAGGGITALLTRLRRQVASRAAPVTVTVEIAGQRTELAGMTDSGNLVRDPVSGRCVIFIAARKLRALLDEPLWRVLTEQRIDRLTALPADTAERIGLLPAETVQGRGMLITLRPDSIWIEGHPCRALIAPAPDIGGGRYDAIVPADLVDDTGIHIIRRKESRIP
ncbi:MAG: sigma-E processing peptidase SpoIIGA [Clostridia bacterium]|nr:sigma-E processing peptidase SpoIIGA [Clostridia bacterium]